MRNTFIITIMLLAALLTACSGSEGAERGDTSGKAPDNTRAQTPTPTEPVYVEDEIFISSEDGKEFYVMRVGDYCLEIPGACEALLPEGIYPNLEDGQIAKLVADVDIYNGGEAGYCGNLCIRDLISVTPVDYEEALSELSIPDASVTPLKYENRLLQYTTGGQSYLFTTDFGNIVVYTEDGRYMEYPYDAQKDLLESFFDQRLAELRSENTQIAPDLDEEGIRDLTDAEYRYYGMLTEAGLLTDMVGDNPLRKDFGLESDAGYDYVGQSASRSAADQAAATAVAKEEWKPLGDNTFENLQLLGESEEFYLFRCDHYYKDKYIRIDTLLVYKTDYYDAETKTCAFEINEENLRHFVAYGTLEYESNEKCLGEFVTEEDDTVTLHRYIMEAGFDDRDTVYLRCQEWKLKKADRVLEYNEEYIR